jgi:hypothetical protein
MTRSTDEAAADAPTFESEAVVTTLLSPYANEGPSTNGIVIDGSSLRRSGVHRPTSRTCRTWATLRLIVSLEAIFLSTFVMIGQNRQAAVQQADSDRVYKDLSTLLQPRTPSSHAPSTK